MSRTSVIVAPTAVALTAIRDALEREAPRNFAGKRDNPISQLLQNAEIGWTPSRGTARRRSGGREALAVSTAHQRHSARHRPDVDAGGRRARQRDRRHPGADVGRGVEKLAGRTLDQRADVRGNVTIMSRPAILPNWRMEPNLAAQVAIGDGALSIAGVKLNVANEVKPMLDRSVNEQVAALHGAAAQRSVPGAGGAARMGEALPLHSARRGRLRSAEACGWRSSRRAPLRRSRASTPPP